VGENARSNGKALKLEETQHKVGLITFDQPGSRVNTLGQAALGELEALLDDLEKRTYLQGLVLSSGKPGSFIAGADIRELASPGLAPEQVKALTRRGLDIIGRFERLPYPTVAAIDGPCMGGGLELALGFDYRLASTHPKTELACPEVKIGLIPGWGGTQRLSRVIGPALAAELICSGDSIRPDRAREIGLIFDSAPPERLSEEALRVLSWARQSDAWKTERRRKQQPVGQSEDQQAFMFAVARAQIMAKTKGQMPAPLAALDAITKGSNLPLDEGLEVESATFIPLVGSPISRNLIAVFFITQRLQKDPGVAATAVQPRTIERVGVMGAGLMGAGIAAAHVRKGISVIMLDSVPAALEKGVAGIGKAMQARVETGRMQTSEMVAALGRLSTTPLTSALADRHLIIEAIVENEEAKVRVYRELEPLLGPETILASNTSTISITRMARALARPGNFAGMHFFNPVDRMPLVEVIRGEATSDGTIVTLVALAKRIGKTPIVVRDCPGFLVNRILFMYLNESLALLEEGADPRLLDKAAVAFGMPMGPVTLNDVVGLDTSLYAGRVINAAFSDRAVNSRILEELVKAGRLGQKSGAGFYSYAKGPRGTDDPAFLAILERYRTGHRKFDLEDVTNRLFLPMLVEASRVLEESIVREPGDADMGLILGTGFPAYKGGILRWADTQGLQKIMKLLSRYQPLGRRFEPTEQMRRLATANKGFYSGN
jgi:3-hydroxyacyl-CoA dehydrogenase/enoyl-CoA hydratase/3-hydroxybutyryl-CoA epimerase/3-hydroxyacyl-CoA dehydrogenase/enoyl-CoA hydratase/3-hydroxybutyryl-CoA epimerase/enoyl-CoA isomerase